MGIRIFDVDPDARPRKSDDIVGKFRSGTQVNGKPMSLDAWRVTSGDPEVMTYIAETYGAKTGPQEWTTEGEDKIEVFTETDEVDVILDGPRSIQTAMALWGRNGLIHKCDGETVSSGQGEGGPCPMAGKSVAERKEAAKAGYGCSPSIQVYFRLAESQDLGKFMFSSGSWGLAGEVEDVEKALAAIDGPTRATLRLELVEYTTKAGRAVSYRYPVIDVRGPADDEATPAAVGAGTDDPWSVGE